MATTDAWMQNAVNAAIQKRIAEIVDAEIATATKRVEDALRKAVASVAMTLVNEYDFSREGQYLVIRVRMDATT